MERPVMMEQFDGSEIAVIGMTCRFPGAKNLDAFWRNLCDGVESITFLKDEEIEPSGVDPAALNDPNYVKAASILEDIELFDAAFFGLTPKEAEIMDPQQRILMECAWEALEHAGYAPETTKGPVGVYVGARTNSYLFNVYSNRDLVRSLGAFQIGLGNDFGFLATHISYKLDLRGPSYALHTACSTALVAIHLACQSLLTGECELALAGAAAINVPQKTGYLYQHGGIVSPDGHCRAFDAQAQGTIFGSGAGIVVLKRLEDAIAAGDQLYAIIKGSATNNEGVNKASFTAPSVYGQTEVILDALANAGVTADTLSYIEAHGTGTALGDPIEIRALTKAFRSSTERKNFCAVGSVKTNLGHLDAAAGIASFIKTVLALEHKLLPPSLHYEQPNPNIDFAHSPFYVNAALSAWKANGLPRRAGVSSFGIGGTNAHIILEEAPEIAPSGPSRPWHILPVSAKTSSALETATTNLAEYLQHHSDLRLADVAYTFQVGRQGFRHRRVLVCRDRDQAVDLLDTLAPRQVFTHFQESSEQPVVFMFPGQGAQYVRMAWELYQTEPAFRSQVDRCAELLRPHLGLDLREVLYPDLRIEDRGLRIEGAESSILYPLSSILDLDQTALAQPALFVIEYALAQVWIEWGVRPQAMIGHSVGEYVAACIAGVFSLEDALALISARGRLMQALPAGAMLAVSLPEHEIQPRLGERLSLAAVNGPGVCAVSGPIDAVEALERQLAAQDVDYRRLHTSHAFHSMMVDPIVDRFTALVEQLSLDPPAIPFISNVTGAWISQEEACDPRYWSRQLRAPVRFADGLATVLEESGSILLEVGPGNTLSRLARGHPRSTAAQAVLASLHHGNEVQSDAQLVLTALGQLWLTGVQVDWQGFARHERRQRLALPTYPFERQRYWVEPAGQIAGAADRRAGLGKKSNVAEWFAIPSWRRTLPPQLRAVDESTGQAWVIFVDGSSLAAGLVSHLAESKRDVVSVLAGPGFSRIDDHVYSINPRSPGDYDALLAELRARYKPFDTIAHLWSITPPDDELSEREDFGPAQDLGYYSLLFLAQALGKTASAAPLHIQVVSNHVFDVSGGELVCPAKITSLGPCKVIPQEYAHITCCFTDIVLPAPDTDQERKLIDQLIAEIGARPSDAVSAYRKGRRWAQTFEPVRLDRGTTGLRRLRESGVYLITGGLGGVGLLLAEYLAQTRRARLVLTGRSGLPNRENWDEWLATHDDQDSASHKIRKLRALEELGAEVLVVSADVASEEQMRSVIAQIDERYGTLNAVIHAAGITSGTSVFTPIAEIDPAASAEQFHPKVHGLYILERVLKGRDLDFVLLFSSNAAVLGGLGFVAYSASNLFMDAFAANHCQVNAVPWISANWDHWPEETRQYVGFQTSMDQYTMTIQESLEAFERVTTMIPDGQVVVSTGDLQARLNLWIRRDFLQDQEQAADGAASATVHTRPQLQSPYVAPRNETEESIAAIWQQILGLTQVGVYDNFFDLGGHSLLATRLNARLRETFAMDIPLSKFFEAPTVAGLAQAVTDIQVEQDSQEKLELLKMLEQLSEEEIDEEIDRLMQ